MQTILLFIGVFQCLAVLRCCELFVSGNLNTSEVPFFSFLFFFCNRFHTDGLHLSHAQMHSIVVLLLH